MGKQKTGNKQIPQTEFPCRGSGGQIGPIGCYLGVVGREAASKNLVFMRVCDFECRHSAAV